MNTSTDPRADLAVVAEPADLESINDEIVRSRQVMPAVRGHGDLLQPRSFTELMRVAEYLAKNASDSVPKSYQGKPGAIVVAGMAGAELGLSLLKALQGIAVINGVPSLYGKTAFAMVTRHQDFDGIQEWEEGDPFDDAQDYVYHVVLKRRGRDDIHRSFSKREAQTIRVQSGNSKVALWDKPGPWLDGYKRRMCRWRAFGFASADQFADALLGFGIVEEMIDVTPQNARPAAAMGRTRSDQVRETITLEAVAPMATAAPTADEGNTIVSGTRTELSPNAQCVNCSDPRAAHDDASGTCGGEHCAGQKCTFTAEPADQVAAPGDEGMLIPDATPAAAEEGGPITSDTPAKIRGTKIDFTTAKTMCNFAREKGMTERELLDLIFEHTGQYVLKQGASVTIIMNAIRGRNKAA